MRLAGFSPDGRLAFEWGSRTARIRTTRRSPSAAKPGAPAKAPHRVARPPVRTPYPPIRGPVWDGDRIVFGVEDGGNLHLYSVAADGTGAPELLVGGEQ